jgi:hypothetical protein
MVNLGKLAKKAKDFADKNGDKVASAVTKATDVVDKKTKGKYSDKLEKIDEAAKKLDKSAKGDEPTAEPGATDTAASDPGESEPGPTGPTG